MKIKLLTIIFLIITVTSCGQKNMKSQFFTQENFVDNFGKEMVSAQDVYTSMANIGLKDNCLVKMDFTFISDKKENLVKLGEFLKSHYPYTIQETKESEDLWELNGETNEIPISSDNLLYWALDMYKRGFEFDARLDGYGGPFDPKAQKTPNLDKSEEDNYFNKAVDCYKKGDLSGSLINWTLTLEINPKDPNSYYSRAIVKNELHTWKAALRDYDKAIEIAPTFANALTNRGSLKDDNGDYSGAVEDYNKVLSFEKVDLENKKQAYFNRGNTKFNMKDKKGACEDWEKALELGADYAKERIDQYCR